MKKINIAYWIFTIWMSLGMVSTGIVQLTGLKEETQMFAHLGYPIYLLLWLGVAKLMGTLAILIPGFPKLREWAYAGFVFTMSGALYSHFSVGDGLKESLPSALLLTLTGLSYYFDQKRRNFIAQSQPIS